jgi:predicted dehydrogenase
VLRFRNGVIGTIDNSRKAVYGYDQRVEILGSEGKIETENCYPNQAVVSDGKSVHTDLPLNFFMERYTESFAAELKSFVTAVREKRTTAVTGIDGRIPVAWRWRRASRTTSTGPCAWKRSEDETIQACLHPHRRASLGACRCIDSGNIPSDDPEVNS